MRLKLITAFLLLISAAFSATAQDDALNMALRNYISEQELTGAFFYTNMDGDVLTASAGHIAKDSDIAPNNSTRFYIASSGKMMVAAAILSLVEEGKIELDGPIWPIIKNIKGINALKNADKVTLRQILNHTSGLAEYLDEAFDEAVKENPTKRWPSAEAISFAFDADPYFAPDEGFEYTNSNYVLLGYILEHFDDALEIALKTRVFDKAGMMHSTVGAIADEPNLSRGYEENDKDTSEHAWASTLADGPVVTTAEDLSKFMHALLGQKLILSQELLNEMLTGSEHDPAYGLGMGIDGDNYGDWFGHAGSYGGFEADVRYYPELNASLVILMNGHPAEEPSFLDIAAKLLAEN